MFKFHQRQKPVSHSRTRFRNVSVQASPPAESALPRPDLVIWPGSGPVMAWFWPACVRAVGTWPCTGTWRTRWCVCVREGHGIAGLRLRAGHSRIYGLCPVMQIPSKVRHFPGNVLVRGLRTPYMASVALRLSGPIHYRSLWFSLSAETSALNRLSAPRP